MRYSYDANVDALYITLIPEGSVARTAEVDDERHVDFNEFGEVVGIEVLNASRKVEVNDLIDRFQLYEVKEFLHEVAGTRFRRSSVTA